MEYTLSLPNRELTILVHEDAIFDYEFCIEQLYNDYAQHIDVLEALLVFCQIHNFVQDADEPGYIQSKIDIEGIIDYALS